MKRKEYHRRIDFAAVAVAAVVAEVVDVVAADPGSAVVPDLAG